VHTDAAKVGRESGLHIGSRIGRQRSSASRALRYTTLYFGPNLKAARGRPSGSLKLLLVRTTEVRLLCQLCRNGTICRCLFGMWFGLWLLVLPAPDSHRSRFAGRRRLEFLILLSLEQCSGRASHR
jgi:hypothetical protein